MPVFILIALLAMVGLRSGVGIPAPPPPTPPRCLCARSPIEIGLINHVCRFLATQEQEIFPSGVIPRAVAVPLPLVLHTIRRFCSSALVTASCRAAAHFFWHFLLTWVAWTGITVAAAARLCPVARRSFSAGPPSLRPPPARSAPAPAGIHQARIHVSLTPCIVHHLSEQQKRNSSCSWLCGVFRFAYYRLPLAPTFLQVFYI